ncbi:MAG: hypothetical protein R3F62_22545 [Planctomycetota bacterium]
MPVLVLLLAVLLALPCGGAIDLCACSASGHGAGCASAAPTPAPRSCCGEAPEPEEHPGRCPDCPTLELPQLPSSVVPTTAPDLAPPPAVTLAPVEVLPAPPRRVVPGHDAWPPPDPVSLFLALGVLRL